MKILVLFSVLALSCISNSAIAQDTRNAELESSNTNLNSTYKFLMAHLTPADQSSLRAAQRLWLPFRDADCGFGWGDKRDCLIARTDEREKQLRDSTYFDSHMNLISIPEPK